jgi:micrococcal nuclease
LRQRFGVEGRDALSALTLNRQVDVAFKGRDRYGRILARISVDGRDASEALVERGLAWHFAVYSDDPRLARIQRAAQQRHVGLWQDSSPTPLWNFRSGSSLATGPPIEGPLHGNHRSHVVHASTCRDYNCVNCTRVFKTLSEAVAAGYRSHRQCLR